MTRPHKSLLWMLVFLAAVTAVCILVYRPLADAFLANPAFNGVILGVLAVGIFLNFREVLGLYRESRWIEDFRRSDPESPPEDMPRLLAPMARMLSRRSRGEFTLSPLSTRSLLDSIRSRLEESRDVARYMTGLLIFLGLLGTFWGLLVTVGSVNQVIGGLDVGQAEPGAAVFERLQESLEGPLSGMATAFSSSLFGLAGALVLGFLDLQAGHAQNRFFNDLEEWLSGATRLSSGALAGDGEAGIPAYVQALLEQTADGLERLQRQLEANEGERRATGQTLRELADHQAELKTVLRDLAQGRGGLSDDLRSELRLISRTLARALGERNG